MLAYFWLSCIKSSVSLRQNVVAVEKTTLDSSTIDSGWPWATINSTCNICWKFHKFRGFFSEREKKKISLKLAKQANKHPVETSKLCDKLISELKGYVGEPPVSFHDIYEHRVVTYYVFVSFPLSSTNFFLSEQRKIKNSFYIPLVC